MANDDDRESQVPGSSEVIEPEPMSETEVRKANPNAGSARRSRRIFVHEGPNGSHFAHIEVEAYGPEEFDPQGPFIMPRPPTIATWICLFAAWIFLGSEAPFTALIGLPINFAALILALVCLTRGGIGTGIMVLLLGTVGSLFVFFVGILRLFF